MGPRGSQTKKHKQHTKCFLTALAGQSSQGRTPPDPRTGQNGDFTVELNRKRPVCPRDGPIVPEMGPVCPRDGSCLSRTLSRPKCLCLLGLSCLNDAKSVPLMNSCPKVPCPSFPCFVGKAQGKPPKEQGFLFLPNPKNLEKKGTTLKDDKKEIKNKGREVQSNCDELPDD